MNPIGIPVKVGERFGLLTVLEKLHTGQVRVRCDCGTRLTVSSMRALTDLDRARVSCGCHKPLRGLKLAGRQ